MNAAAKDSGNDDELELNLDDDDLEAVEDDKPYWPKWDEPKTVDLEVTAYTSDGGRNFDQDPCPELKGWLLKRIDDHGPGELAGITAGQTKLGRLLKKGNPKVGDRVVVKFLGTVKTSNGTMKDFQVFVGPLKPKPPAQSEKPPY